MSRYIGYGSSSTPWMTLKIVVVAPMPSASASTAAAVNDGCLRTLRNA